MLMVEQSGDELDRVTIGRAAQYDFRLFQRETDTGELVFEWRSIEYPLPSPPFVTRQLAIDWMVSWLDGATPAAGMLFPTLFQRDAEPYDDGVGL